MQTVPGMDSTLMPQGVGLRRCKSWWITSFGPGLQNLKGAEVHVVVRSHGLATGNVEQISTLFGDCNADDGMGNMVCFDPQAAAFPLP